MKPRTCWVQIAIVNDKAEQHVYSCMPVPTADLGPSVAGFRLTNLTRNPSPVYTVVIESGGVVSCDCQQHGLAALQARRRPGRRRRGADRPGRRHVRAEALLDGVEHDFACKDDTIKNLLASVSNLTEKNALLNRQLDEATALLRETEEKLARRRRTRTPPVPLPVAA